MELPGEQGHFSQEHLNFLLMAAIFEDGRHLKTLNPSSILLCVLLAVLLPATTGCGDGLGSDTPENLSEAELIERFGGFEIGGQVPGTTFQVVGSEGGTFQLPSTDGTDTLLAFVSKKCAACAQDVPLWKTLSELAPATGARFALVSLEGDLDSAREYPVHYGFTGITTLFLKGIGKKLNVKFVPYYILVDAQGRVRNRRVGVRPVSEFERVPAAAALLQPKP